MRSPRTEDDDDRVDENSGSEFKNNTETDLLKLYKFLGTWDPSEASILPWDETMDSAILLLHEGEHVFHVLVRMCKRETPKSP